MNHVSKPTTDLVSVASQRLLEAAQVEFAEKGFDGATIRDICKKAGANVASINYYFGGKDGLYIETVKFAHLSTMRMDRFPKPIAGIPPVEKLKEFIRVMVSQTSAPASPSAMKLIMREMADPGKAAHVIVQEFIQPAAFMLREILNELLPELDEPHVLAVGFSIMGQILFYRQNRPISELIFGKSRVEQLDVKLVTDHITRFSLAALGLDQPLRPTKTAGTPN